MCSNKCCINCFCSLGLMIKILVFNILPSLMDLTTDILNGLDMIGSVKLSEICKLFGIYGGKNNVDKIQLVFNVCKDTEVKQEWSNNAFTRQTVGITSLAVVFLPGIVKAMKMLAKHVRNNDYIKIPTVIFYLPFPLYIMYVQLKALFQPNTKDMQKRLIRTLSMEAFYESFPQLVLQTITIMYGYPVTIIQILSIVFSFILLAKTTPMIDSQETSELSTETENKSKIGCCTSLKNAVKYIFWLLPLYLSSIIYKVAVFSLTVAYFRTWALLTMVLLMIELIILAKVTGFQGLYEWVYPVFSNFFIINIGGANTSSSDHIKKARSYVEKRGLYLFPQRVNQSTIQCFKNNVNL